MLTIKPEGSVPIKMWVGTRPVADDVPAPQAYAPDIEPSALEQLKNIARLPFVSRNGVAAMPDVHYGIGATVGSVIATRRAIIPAAGRDNHGHSQ